MAPLDLRLQTLAALALLSPCLHRAQRAEQAERVAFHDDDCELASNLPGTTVAGRSIQECFHIQVHCCTPSRVALCGPSREVSWTSFRELLFGGCGAADELLEELSRGEHWSP